MIQFHKRGKYKFEFSFAFEIRISKLTEREIPRGEKSSLSLLLVNPISK